MRNLKQRVISMLTALLLVLTTVFGGGVDIQQVQAEEATGTETLSLECRSWGTNKLMQVNTNLPLQTETNKYNNFTPSTSGYTIDSSGSAQNFGWAGFSEPEGENKVVITFNFNTEMTAGQKFVLKKDSVFAFGVKDGEEYDGQTKYILDKDYTFVYNGGESWSLQDPELSLEYRGGTAGYLQVNTDLPEDIECKNFLMAEQGITENESTPKTLWVGMAVPENEKTVVFTFTFTSEESGKAYQAGEEYTLKEGSVFTFELKDGAGTRKYVLDKDYTFTFNGTDWAKSETPETPEIPETPETKELTLECRSWGTNKLMQVNTNLPLQTETNKYNNFTPSTSGYTIDSSGSAQNFGWAGFSEPKGENKVVITFNFNTEMTAGQKFVLKKDSVFAFGVKDSETYAGQTKYILDKDYTFVYNGGESWSLWEPEKEPESLNFQYKWGNGTILQVVTNLPTTIADASFLNNKNGWSVTENGQNFGWANTIKADGKIILTFNFNKSFTKGASYTVKKGSVFAFGETKYVLDKDYTFTFNGVDWLKHKNLQHVKKKNATCTTDGNIAYWVCKDAGCGKYYDDAWTKVIEKKDTVIKATGKHTTATVVTKKAKYKSNGSQKEVCSVCKKTIGKSSQIYAPKTVTVSTLKYNGKNQTATVVVKDSKGKVIPASNYTVTGHKQKNIGSYTVTVTFKKSSKYYTGTIKGKCKVELTATKLGKLTAGSKKLTVKWAKQTKKISGYQIEYSTKQNFKGAKKVTIKSNKTTSTTIKGLQGKKKYYVRIRTYCKSGKKTYYSSWSSVKNVTTKK